MLRGAICRSEGRNHGCDLWRSENPPHGARRDALNASLSQIVRSPILLEPNRVWRFYRGGRMIDLFKHNVTREDSFFPEEWVGSTVQAVNPGDHFKAGEGLTLISNDLARPVTLKSVIEAFPEEMLGTRHVKAHGTNAALLAKLLDTATRLTIHAHPDRQFAERHLHSCYGKTEAWFVLETRPEVEDPYVLIAFKEEVSRQDYRLMLDRQDIPGLMRVLHRVSVRPGDVVYVRAGLPHAIGEGVFMVELQEPTDFSIILERLCAGFTFNEQESFMGLDPTVALSAIDHRVYSEQEVRAELLITPRVLRFEGESKEVELLGCETTECFAGHRLEVKGMLQDDSGRRSSILIVLDGKGTLKHHHGEIPLRRGVELFIPAAAGEHLFVSTSGMSVFKCLPALS